MAKKTYDFLFKLLLIGDSDVGKTEILFKYCDKSLNANFISTIGIDFKVKTIKLNGKNIKLQLWDTAGQERFQSITTAYYRGAMGIMLVYDITNAKSFDSIEKWLKNIKEHASEDVEIMVLGNRCDMEDKRIITQDKGEEFAREHCVQFMEVSSKADINIEGAFSELVEAILSKTSRQDQRETTDNVQVNREHQEAMAMRQRCS
ncbi:unnamed protein product [Meganyctiphanes norvegica]|uniref:Ras-related protein Rab-13 n=1 Tax=Meganyctiphanes norvegica TaxID=48144 RepID=A0AAV2PK66_MEGNR